MAHLVANHQSFGHFVFKSYSVSLLSFCNLPNNTMYL